METKKSKFARAVEIATNLSIIAVALVGAMVLVKNYLLRPTLPPLGPTAQATAARNPNASGEGQRTPPSGPATGSQISLPGINWNESEETVVLALSDKCHFCTESAPFYQRLTQELAGSKKVRLVAVFPQEVDAGKKYLDGLKVSIADIAQAQLSSVGVRELRPL